MLIKFTCQKYQNFAAVKIPKLANLTICVYGFFQIVLQDSLHQPQYVEKLEKVIRFIIKEKSLSLQDLDDIWAAQVGQHEAIVKNVHDLLAKLAWDFSPEQLDHLFECFQVRVWPAFWHDTIFVLPNK